MISSFDEVGKEYSMEICISGKNLKFIDECDCEQVIETKIINESGIPLTKYEYSDGRVEYGTILKQSEG